jgi:hypothetical protein
MTRQILKEYILLINTSYREVRVYIGYKETGGIDICRYMVRVTRTGNLIYRRRDFLSR